MSRTSSSFGFRIFRLNIIMVFALGVSLSALFVREQSRNADEALDRRGATLARSLASASEVGAFGGGSAALEPALRGALADRDVQYAIVYDVDGKQIDSLTPDGSLVPPEGSGRITPNELVSLRTRTGLIAGWNDPSTLIQLRAVGVTRPPVENYPVAGMDYWFPIVVDVEDSVEDAALLGEETATTSRRELIGVARVGMTRASLATAQERSIGLAILTLAVSMIIATVASLELSRRLVAPLKHLSGGARALGEGRLAERVRVETNDEIGETALAFNKMAMNLEDAYRGLEEKVAARTSELFDEKHRLEAVINTVDEGVFMLDSNGIFRMVNRKALEMYDLPRSEVIGHHYREIAEVIAPRTSSPAAHRDRIDFLLKHPKERSVDIVELIQPERKVLQRFSAPVQDYDENGYPTGLLGRISVYRDITRETEVDRMKSEFISTVSHELRTPLTSIKGSLGLILGGAAGPLPDDAIELLSIAQNNSDRLIRLINDILDISKIESGKMKLKISDFDLVGIVKESVQGIEGFALRNEVKVAIVIEEKTMQVSADRDRIHQVLTNLLSNAVKFSRKGGTVTLEGGRDRAGMWRFSIKDAGIGIPADQIGKLFQKFQQVEGTFANQVGGSGLGLAICRALVQEHGGDIWVESVHGTGSTFSFTLPAPETTASEAVAELIAATGTVDGTPRVLVVDDDRDVANLIRMYLEREGFDCVTAIGGIEALKAVKSGHFDAVTLDLNMPGVSGFDVAKAMKEDPLLKDTPIIFVSVSEAQETEAASLAFADWVTKPIDPLRLVAAVKRHATKKLGRPQILVVDDDPDIQKLLGIILSREGFEVENASNGEEALRRVAARRPDLLILDLVMPAMDGFSVVKTLREQRATRRIPILILTAKDLSEDERRILATGATTFLTKSYANREALLKEVVDLLNGALRATPDPPTGESRPIISSEFMTDRASSIGKMVGKAAKQDREP